MKDLLYSRMTPTKHWTDAACQKLHFARRGAGQTVTGFGAYIVMTCEGTDITDNNKRMVF